MLAGYGGQLVGDDRHRRGGLSRRGGGTGGPHLLPFVLRAAEWNLAFPESGALGGSLCLSAAGLNVEGRWEAILRASPTVVVGAAADFRALAEAAPAGVAGAQAPSVRLVLGGGQPGEAEAVRVQAARLWPEARVWDYVALPETGVVAFECPARPGVMHLAEPALFPEIVDPATGRSLDSGDGELVLTTLFRAGSPLVRYRTGCRAAICADTACECGRHQLAIEGGITSVPAQTA